MKSLALKRTAGALFPVVLGLTVFACSHGKVGYRDPAGRPSYPRAESDANDWQTYGNPSYPKGKATKLPVEGIDCFWVDKAGKGYSRVDETPAYPVPDCTDANGRDQKVCNGTTRCRVTVKTTTGTKNFTAFFENVMCGGKGAKCKEATACVKDGGILQAVKADLEFIRNETTITPPKSKVHDK